MATRLGLELFDGVTRISTFVIPEETTRGPFCVGRQGQVILPFDGVLPVHAVFVYQNGRLWAASASAMNPAIVGVDAIPTEWVEIDVRSTIKMGKVTVRPFLVHERAKTLTPSGIGRPRPSPGSSAPTVIVHRAPPVQETSGPMQKIAQDWQRASTAVKLLCAALPFVALFLAIR